MPPKLSIITPSYNQAPFLEETILSVLNQNYPNLEYIVVDGGSTDGSVDIIRRYEKHLAYWISEKDRGQVHAINKGIEKVTGDIAAFINSDDLYLPGAFNAVINHFESNADSHWVCGDTIMFGEGHPTELIRSVVPKSAAHCLSWAYKAPQPGMFWKQKLMKFGFQECWPYDFDCDMYTRLLLAGYTCEYLPVPLAAYRLHSASKTVAEGHRQEKEFDLIAEHYEDRLEGSGRRWCRATRFLRLSYQASEAGQRREGAQWLLRALVTYPEAVAARPFWGCFRRLSLGGASQANGAQAAK
jgi:glycosyltransferase involved in cell wall biosynthesis